MTTMQGTTTEMQRDYIKEFSHALGREMEVLHFGHAGTPLLVFPTSMGRFYQWEDFGLVGALSDFIESGAIQLICVDSVDGESWYARDRPPAERVARRSFASTGEVLKTALPARLLAAGTAVTALGFLAAGLTGGFLALLVCLAVGGLGSGCQHPLSSALVSRAYETGPRRMALGTYNFAGDLGKVAVPAAVAFIMPWVGWRGAVERDRGEPQAGVHARQRLDRHARRGGVDGEDGERRAGDGGHQDHVGDVRPRHELLHATQHHLATALIGTRLDAVRAPVEIALHQRDRRAGAAAGHGREPPALLRGAAEAVDGHGGQHRGQVGRRRRGAPQFLLEDRGLHEAERAAEHGVRDREGEVISNLSIETARELTANGIAVGGMAAKLESAQSALIAGVARVRICDLAGLSDGERGTFITHSQSVVL